MVQSRLPVGPDFPEITPVSAAGGVLTKLPVTVCGAFTSSVRGVVAPVNPPLKPVNTNPEFGTALIVVLVPANTQPPPVTVPPESGTACVVTRYCVRKIPVYVTM